MRARIGKREIRRFLSAFAPRTARQDDVVRVWFDDIPWRDAAGTVLDGFRLSLEYEFHPDGATGTSSSSSNPGTL